MGEMSRRDFVGSAAGAVSVVGMFGLVGGPEAVAAARAAQAAEAQGADFVIGEAEMAAAAAEGRRMDPVRFVTDMSKDELDEILLAEADVTEDFTTPDGTTIPAVYLRLRNRINRLGIGVGSQVSTGKEWDVFLHFWSEDDAAHELEMPLNKWFTAEEYAVVSGRPEDECREIADSLAERGLICRYTRAGVPFYSLYPQIPGFWEVHELWEHQYGTTESIQLFNYDMQTSHGADSAAWVNSYYPVLHIQPVSRDVVRGEMASYSDWEAALERNESFCVMPCQCRMMRDSLGMREEECAANHPSETCLTMGEMADFFVEIGVATRLTREEARERFRSNVDAGLVIEAVISKDGGIYCACHCDCCVLLGTYRALNGECNTVQYFSDYNLGYDAETCIGCGACVERCPMRSITLGEDGVCVMDAACARCGQCALVCPVDARWLEAKPNEETFDLADDVFQDFWTMSRVRAGMGQIRDFTGEEFPVQ